MAASKKLLLKGLPPDEKMKDTFDRLSRATDQAAALTGAAYLELLLEKLLTASFRPLSEGDTRRMFDGSGNGILCTLSSKIRMAYAIGVIDDEMYGDLKLINDIRNVFAHTLHDVDFNHELIKADCSKLSYEPTGLTNEQPSAKEQYLHGITKAIFHIVQEIRRPLLTE